MNSNSILFPKKYKLVSLGEQSVGKTSLITRFMYDNFDSTYQATIGIDFLVKNITINGRTVRLQLWDTAGQERFRSLIPCYIRDSGIALVVYDVTNIASFNQTTKWIADVKEERGDDVLIMLVGNKVDLVEQRQVTTAAGQEKADGEKIFFMETSAKTGHNVKELFARVATEITESMTEAEEPKIENISLLSANPPPPVEPTTDAAEGACSC
jgi:small GTP-binding protein